jgi:membrane protease YdiL (CAAX protease family)
MNESSLSASVSTPAAPAASGRSGLWLYFLIAYGFTWCVHLAFPALGLEFDPNPASPSMILYLIGLAGPLVGAVAVSAVTEGWAGVRRLLAAGLCWRFGPQWYVFALLLIPGLYLLFVGLYVLSGGPRPEPLLVLTSATTFLVMGQVYVVVAEEFGWRGFALPRLQRRFGSLGASLVLGVLWAGWHLPMFFVPGSFQYGQSFTVYLAIVTMQTILITLLYNRTGGSVLACMLFHASLNAAAFVINVPADLPGWYGLATPLLVLIAVPFLPQPFFRFGR